GCRDSTVRPRRRESRDRRERRRHARRHRPALERRALSARDHARRRKLRRGVRPQRGARPEWIMSRRLTSPRALVAWMILLLWLGGLGFLVRREYFRPNTERFAEAALRVSPGAVYY